MKSLVKMIQFQIRKVKVNIASTINTTQTQKQKKPYQKITFDEEQILKMGQNRARGRSVANMFKDKLKQKQERDKRKQKNQKQEDFFNEQQGVNYSYEKEKKLDKVQFKIFKTHHNSQRIQSDEMSLKDLSKIRLEVQYLPEEYLKKVQKVFHKYNQSQLRQISQHFSKLMNLRYTQQKIDYEVHSDLGFQKLQQKKVGGKIIEPIYLIGRDQIYQQKDRTDTKRRTDDDSIAPQISYTQNIVVSYLLMRVPRTFATAVRTMTQIKYKYQNFKPKSFIDFGSGLSSGAAAFIDVFKQQAQVYCVQPSPKMRKMSKYLTDYTNIQHFQTLGQLSGSVRQVDIVYAGYVLNQLKPELIQVYLEALWSKVKAQGFLVLTQYGNPFGARIIHQARKWILTKSDIKIAAPCPHQMKCPLAKSSSWCHFDQPAGMYPRQIFGKLPTDNSIKYEKMSYLIIQNTSTANEQQERMKPNATDQWDRIIYPLVKRGKHFIMNLCTKNARFEKRIIGKSNGEQYKEGRKLRWGDLWRFGKRIPNKFRKQRSTGKRLW